MLSERIKALREASYQAEVCLDHERPEIVTDFYMENEGKYSIPVMRALAFKTVCEKRTIYIGDGELIVGERGPRPKAVTGFPEVACNSVEDLELLQNQERIPYAVSRQCLEVYRDKIIPYWKGRSLRDKMFAHLDDTWKNAYEAGVYTEFLEQRAPGCVSLDGSIYQVGLRDQQKKIRETIEKLNFFEDPQATSKREELEAMDISCEAAILLAERYAKLAEKLAETEADDVRRQELLTIASNCRRVPAYAPENLWQAIQMYWFLHIGVISEMNGWDGCNPGHIDQHMYPFYKKDIEAGKLTKEFAKELLSAFWIKFNNNPAPAKYGVTAQESGSYNDFVNINLGGVTSEGEDAVNELSYLFLEIIEDIHLIQPQANLILSEKNPDEFLKAACRVIRKGYGYPSLFNCETIVKEQVYCGKSIKDAREGGINGCVETACHGKEASISNA